MKRILAWALCAAWIVTLVSGTQNRIRDLKTPLKLLGVSVADRKVAESADPVFHAMLARLQGLPGKTAVLLLVRDHWRRDEFQYYRAAYELYPRRILYVPIDSPQALPTVIPFISSLALLDRTMPTGSRVDLPVDAALADAMRARAVGYAAYFDRDNPGNWRLFEVRRISGRRALLVGVRPPDPPPIPGQVRGWLTTILILSAVWGSGWILVRVLGLARACGGDGWAAMGLSWILGAGLGGLGVQTLLVAVPALGLGGAVCAWVLLVAVLAAIRHPAPGAEPGADEIRPPGPAGWEWFGIGLAAVGLAWSFLLSVAPGPGGGWDTWAIWHIKAKAVLDANGIPFGMLSDERYLFTHPVYPLGIPILGALLAGAAGDMNGNHLRLATWMSFPALLLVVRGLTVRLGFPRHGWIVVGVLGTVPFVVDHAWGGYADLPLAAVISASLLVVVSVWKGVVPAWTVGLMAGIVTGTKSDGIGWASALLCLLVWWAFRGRIGFRSAMGGLLLAGALAAPWSLARGSHHITSRIFSFSPAAMALAAPTRVPMVMRGVMAEGLGAGMSFEVLRTKLRLTWRGFRHHQRGKWNLMWYGVLIAGLAAWRGWADPLASSLGLAVLVQSLVYGAAYMASTCDPAWHIATSLDRLMMHMLVPCLAAILAAWSGRRADPSGPDGAS